MTGQRIRIELWAQHWCDRCWNPDQVLKRKDYRGSGCPLLAAALQGAVPAEWEPAPRKVAEAKDLYRCTQFRDRPPVYRPQLAKPEGTQEAMFEDLQPSERQLVAVPGWPDYRVPRRPTG